MPSRASALPPRGHADAAYLVLRNGVWQYRRQVPKSLAHIEPRRDVRISTGARDKTTANSIAARLNAEVEEHWRLMATTTTPDQLDAARQRFAAAARLATRLGVTYKPAAELAEAPIRDLLDRVELVSAAPAAPPAVAVAALGGAGRPRIKLSELFATFEQLAADRLIGKSDDQIRKWANPRRRALANLIDVVGDKHIPDIDRDDALTFRSWWIDRVREEHYDQGSANKDLGYIANMMRTLDDAWRLKLTLPFAGIRIAGERHNPRVAYEPEFVRKRILPATELAALNDQARAVTLLVALTGMRPSEIVALTPARILLTAEVPHVQIRPEDRQLKSDSSVRDMPLVGRALEIIKPFSTAGFPRYCASPDSLSATVNKALTAAGLRPTPEHTLYSLRHTFKDRLIAIEAPHRIQDMLMGHAPREIAYGAGPTLQHRAEWLKRVWD